MAFCAASTDFVFDVSPPPSLPFEFCIFTSQLDIFGSSRLPTTFKWGQYHIELYFGQHPCLASGPLEPPILEYASLSMGGSLIKTLTSATYSPPSRKCYAIFSQVAREDHSPALMLTEGLEPGQCWAFHRDAGQLGIQLTQAIHVSSLVVGHMNMSSTTSAPKKVILWGLKPVNSDVCIALGDVGALTPNFGSRYCGIHLLSSIHEPSRLILYQNFTTNMHHSHHFD